MLAVTEENAVAPIDPATRRLLPEALRICLHEHRILIAIAIAYALIGGGLLAWRFDGLVGALAATFPPILGGNLVIVASVAAVWTLVFLARTRPAHPFAAIGNAFFRGDVWSTALARLVVLVPLTALVTGMFSAIKPQIPHFVPFVWDETFISLDAWLHFGVQPWELLQPVLGYPFVTALIDDLYYLWFPVLYHTFYWQVFTRRDAELRLRFLTAFMLSWMLVGSLAAILLSSTGPVFAAFIGVDASAFHGLFAYLSDVDAHTPLFALEVQDWLWASYTEADPMTPLKGISAMPSMHVAIVVLFALFGWRRHWMLGVAYTAFAIIIFVGSIHLGFHYAADGYVAAIMMLGIWWISGKIARRSLAATEDRRSAD